MGGKGETPTISNTKEEKEVAFSLLLAASRSDRSWQGGKEIGQKKN